MSVVFAVMNMSMKVPKKKLAMILGRAIRSRVFEKRTKTLNSP